MSWSVDALLTDKYRLLRLLGTGSAGSVWEAENTLVGKRVALKILHSHLAGHEEIRARFLAEARASARIANAHVVDVFDLGETPDATPFMVMELCEGETLSHIIEGRGAVGAAYACELMMQVCTALEAAHALGIVHRDLKPANVMVLHPAPDQPHAKVLDFGIAKGVHPDGQDPEEQDVFGTPHYMAPEQAAGDHVDHRADIYAAGAILYELLAGRPPFDGKMPSLILADVLTRQPESVARYATDLPVGLEELVKKTLEKDPADRPPSARALRNALSAYLRPSSAPSPGPNRRPQTVPPLPLVSKSKKPTLELVRDSSVPPPPFPPGNAPPSAGNKPGSPRPAKPKSPGVKLSPSSKKRPPPPPRKRKP
ncbi:MAG: serine/threonine protein kinase [Myxococcales bacterium]|nr:serine/threonine protein kinase [Myxococcales bacterium]